MEAITLQIKLASVTLGEPSEIADAVERAAAEIAQTGSWEGAVRNDLGAEIGTYRLDVESAPPIYRAKLWSEDHRESSAVYVYSVDGDSGTAIVGPLPGSAATGRQIVKSSRLSSFDSP